MKLKHIQGIYNGCEFKHAVANEGTDKGGFKYVKEEPIEVILDIITKNKNINTVELNTKSPFSVPTTRKHTYLLLDEGKITRTVIGRVGVHERVVYNKAEDL